MNTESEQITEDLIKLSFFTDLGKAVVSAKTIHDILDVVIDKIGSIFNPQIWSLLLIDHKTKELVFKVASGPQSQKLIGSSVKRYCRVDCYKRKTPHYQ